MSHIHIPKYAGNISDKYSTNIPTCLYTNILPINSESRCILVNNGYPAHHGKYP